MGRVLTGTVTFVRALPFDITMSRLRPLLLSVAALAALPAAAQAARHWSSPQQVVAPPADPLTQSTGMPQALAGSAGQALGFAADGEGYPLSLSGTIAGGLSATRITTASKGGAHGAVGADGTVAAVWSTSGTATSRPARPAARSARGSTCRAPASTRSTPPSPRTGRRRSRGARRPPTDLRSC